jgi:hypothetical protein
MSGSIPTRRAMSLKGLAIGSGAGETAIVRVAEFDHDCPSSDTGRRELVHTASWLVQRQDDNQRRAFAIRSVSLSWN